ncbi:unnamed protein product, partial [Amoebophrya sp. A25]|eukprot:GSA25T00009695001.1
MERRGQREDKPLESPMLNLFGDRGDIEQVYNVVLDRVLPNTGGAHKKRPDTFLYAVSAGTGGLAALGFWDKENDNNREADIKERERTNDNKERERERAAKKGTFRKPPETAEESSTFGSNATSSTTTGSSSSSFEQEDLPEDTTSSSSALLLDEASLSLAPPICSTTSAFSSAPSAGTFSVAGFSSSSRSSSPRRTYPSFTASVWVGSGINGGPGGCMSRVEAGLDASLTVACQDTFLRPNEKILRAHNNAAYEAAMNLGSGSSSSSSSVAGNDGVSTSTATSSSSKMNKIKNHPTYEPARR